MNQEELNYLTLLEAILEKGEQRQDRTGTGTLACFGGMLCYDLSSYTVPVLTTKKVLWKKVIAEMIWMISGDTNIKYLHDHNVKIWDQNAEDYAEREKREGREVPEGDLGPLYGFQMRSFGGDYPEKNGFDQIKHIVNGIQKNPHSRYHIMSVWNPAQVFNAALPPCHVLTQFFVHNDKTLSCVMYQRSCDMFLGVPFNMVFYSVLTHVIAEYCGLTAREFKHVLGDYHIYLNHVDQVKEQISRMPYEFPRLAINRDIDGIPGSLTPDDFELSGYKHHPAIKAPMSV